jgi:glycosyltransferase involved in cell wall biosynthesis
MNQPPTEIIHIAVNRWDSMVQREQHLLMGLSEHYRILFIDPPLSCLTVSLGKIHGKRWTFGSRLRQINGRLTVYTPPAFPPFSQKVSWIHRTNTRLLVSRIQRLIQEYSFDNYILGLSWPLWGGVLSQLNPRFSYYDCSDDYLNYPGLKVGKEKIRRAEEKLLRAVDLVFCSGRRLKETKSLLNPNCFLIPNGVELSFFKNGQRNEEVPPDIRKVKKPILGYVGTIGAWLDFDTLIPLARARPDWSIVMIGPVTSRQFSSIMAGVPNLHWLGEKGYHELPDYLRRFDVCLIPFKRDEFTANIYPTKLHQYFGMGKPVVSSFLPDLESFRPWVKFYRHQKEMEEAVQESLKEESGERARERRRIASENTWDRRVNSMIEIFNHYLEERPSPMTTAKRHAETSSA